MGRGGRCGGGRSSGGGGRSRFRSSCVRPRGASRGGFGRAGSHFHSGRRARIGGFAVHCGCGKSLRGVIAYATLLTAVYVILPSIPLFANIIERIMLGQSPFFLYAMLIGTLLFMAFVAFLVFRSLLRHHKREAEKEGSSPDAGTGRIEDPALKELEEKYKASN